MSMWVGGVTGGPPWWRHTVALAAPGGLQVPHTTPAADTKAADALSLPLPRAARENEPHLLSTYGNMWLPWGEQERGESFSSVIQFKRGSAHAENSWLFAQNREWTLEDFEWVSPIFKSIPLIEQHAPLDLVWRPVRLRLLRCSEKTDTLSINIGKTNSSYKQILPIWNLVIRKKKGKSNFEYYIYLISLEDTPQLYNHISQLFMNVPLIFTPLCEMHMNRNIGKESLTKISRGNNRMEKVKFQIYFT